MSMSATELSNARLLLADQGTDAVQSIQIDNATGGTWRISFDGEQTSALAYNAGANDVQNAICALTNVGVGNATVVLNAGVPGTVYYVIYFAGDLGSLAQPIVTVASSLTGTGVIVTVVQQAAGGVTAFSDDEINAMYSLANQNFFLAVSYCFNALWSNAAKFADYVAGQTEEKKSQIEKALKGLAAYYYELSRAGSQVQFASLIPIPPKVRAIPVTQGTPATSLAYAPPYRRNWRNGWW